MFSFGLVERPDYGSTSIVIEPLLKYAESPWALQGMVEQACRPACSLYKLI